jgi:hypothetical protein
MVLPSEDMKKETVSQSMIIVTIILSQSAFTVA